MSSERVRLEVAILAADDVPPKNAPPPQGDSNVITILAIAADADIRWYVQDCLRGRENVRVLAAATVADALTLAARETPRLLIVDSSETQILMALHVRAVILVDERRPDDRPGDSNVRFVARPFTSVRLWAEVDALLSS